MKIRIDNKDYKDAVWNVGDRGGNLTYLSSESIVSILDEMSNAKKIEVYDDDDILTGVWHISGVLGISKSEEGVVNVHFNVSILDAPAEEQLQKNLDDSVDAIMELAELFSEIEETVDENVEEIASIHEWMIEADKKLDTIPEAIPDKFAVLFNLYASLDDRVKKLENKEG